MQNDILIKLKNSVNFNKISHAYLLSVDDFYSTNISIFLIKEILKSYLKKNDSQIDEILNDKSFDDIRVIKPNGKNIKKEQIGELITEFSNKSVKNNIRFYIIEYVEDLNQYSANSLLKFLEEPEDKIVAILVTKKINMVLPTIISRCQTIRLNQYKNDYNNYENVEQYKKIFFDIIQSNKINIGYLTDLYAYNADELESVLMFFLNIYSEILKMFFNTKYKSDIILKEEFELIKNKIDLKKINQLINRVQVGINYLKNNINTRIVLDFVLLGGEL